MFDELATHHAETNAADRPATGQSEALFYCTWHFSSTPLIGFGCTMHFNAL